MKLLTISGFLMLANWASANPPQRPFLESSSSSSSSSLIKLHKALVEHESITSNEQSVTNWLVDYLESQNFTVEKQKVSNTERGEDVARYNILAYVGKERKTRTLISSHLDTVPPFWPYERKGDEIWGRGSVDAKGSVAAQITAVEELVAAKVIREGDVAMLYVLGEGRYLVHMLFINLVRKAVNSKISQCCARLTQCHIETGGDGMKKANSLGLAWETVIFGEPTELKLASGHKGIMSVDISAKGKAGHSGYPELGRSANAMLIPSLAALLKVELPSSEKYGNTTLNIGLVEGGVAANVIPEDARAKIAIRVAGGTPETLEKMLLDAINSGGEELDVEIHYGYGPVSMDTDVDG
jgi:acetylornithine deacetylase